jgi:hypothetical protein
MGKEIAEIADIAQIGKQKTNTDSPAQNHRLNWLKTTIHHS